MTGDSNSIKTTTKSNINTLDTTLEKLSKTRLTSCITILGSKLSNVETSGIVRGIFHSVMNVLSVSNRICKISLYCGIDAVNSRIVLLIIPAKKRNSTTIKISIKVIASPNGIFRLVIKRIAGEQMIAINRESKKGITISPASFTPARIITSEAKAIKNRVKGNFCIRIKVMK